VATVTFTPNAARELDVLLVTRNLPASARDRIRGHLALLGDFPLAAKRVDDGRWAGARAFHGPWWLLFVYVYRESDDAVFITTVLDKRTAVGSAAVGRP
jgi:plasmid stabilization system protein ParE